jgi:ArsR family transcriptional regulator
MKLSCFGKAIGDDIRVRIMGILTRHELNVGEIVRSLDLSQPRVSRHLRLLSEIGLVTWRKDGLWVFYRSAKQGRAGDFVSALRPFLDCEPEIRDDRERAGMVVSARRTQSRHFFDQAAFRWEQMNREILGDFDLPREMASRVGSCSSLVDLGCGPGKVLECLVETVPVLIGVDSSSKMLERASQVLEGRPGVSLRIGELEHLPLRDREVGCATMSMVLHHLDDPQTVINEVARVLEPGGTFVLADFERHEDETLRTRFFDRWLGFAPGTIRNWLEQAGFHVLGSESFAVNNGLTVMFFSARKK